VLCLPPPRVPGGPPKRQSRILQHFPRYLQDLFPSNADVAISVASQLGIAHRTFGSRNGHVLLEIARNERAGRGTWLPDPAAMGLLLRPLEDCRKRSPKHCQRHQRPFLPALTFYNAESCLSPRSRPRIC
jgi:hypothetical protein